MSRISRLRSMTLTLSRLSRLFCCAGRSSSSATRRSKPVSLFAWRELLGLALAHVPVRVDVAAVLPLGADDVGARRGRQGGELGQAVVGGPAVVVAGVDGDEERLLDGRGEVDRLSGGSWPGQHTGSGQGVPGAPRGSLDPRRSRSASPGPRRPAPPARRPSPSWSRVAGRPSRRSPPTGRGRRRCHTTEPTGGYPASRSTRPGSSHLTRDSGTPRRHVPGGSPGSGAANSERCRRGWAWRTAPGTVRARRSAGARPRASA